MSDPRPTPEEPSPTAAPRTTARPALPRAAWALGAGGLVLGLVVGGCVGLGVGAAGGALVAGGGGPLPSGLLPGLPPGPGERSVAQALPDELPRLRAFVAEQRGLPWQEEVPVRALADEEFEEVLAGGDHLDAADDPVDEPADEQADEQEWPVGLDDPGDGRAETYAALGLTPSATAYTDAWGAGDSAVAGFYDAETEQVVLRGATWTPTVEETLVHELVHALDDQHVDLSAHVDEERTPEAVSAETAVVEGDAERVTWAWYDSLDEQALADYDAAQDDGRPAGDEISGAVSDDPLVGALVRFPYDYGYVAVEAVDGAGGAAGVSELLRDPLTTTEQVLAARPDPSASPGLAAAVDVAAPGAPEGAEVLGTGQLGLFPLSLLPLVGDARGEGYRLEDDVVTFAWAGDAWTTWVDPADDARACTAVLVRLDDARGRDDLAADLAGWVEGAAGASLAPVGGADLELRRCGDR